MHAHKIKVIIPENHQITFKLPDDFPSGQAEVIILADLSASKKKFVKMAGTLSSDMPPPMKIDPISDSLRSAPIPKGPRMVQPRPSKLWSKPAVPRPSSDR